MIVKVEDIPVKGAFRQMSGRLGIVKNFLDSGYVKSEIKPEEGDTPRRLYNGLLMAVRRAYEGRVRVCWRYGRVFLERTDDKQEEK